MWRVRYETRFDAQIASARVNGNGPCRIDDVIDGVEWALANDPTRCPRIGPDSNLRVIKTDPVDHLPGYWVVFAIHEDEHLVSLELLVEIPSFPEEDLPT